MSTNTPATSALAGEPITRRGKIARLPRPIRETLNGRLADGEAGPTLLAWLNAQPEVQSVLAEQFDSRPITTQNLSEWRHGGYIDWEQKENLRDALTGLVEDLDDLQIGQPHKSIAERCAELQAMALGRLLMAAMVEPVSERREQRILALVRAINNVRRCDHDLERVRLQREHQHHVHVGMGALPSDEAAMRESARRDALWNECFRQESEKTTTQATPPKPIGAPHSKSTPVHSVHPSAKPAQSQQIQVNPTKSKQSPTAETPSPLSGGILPATRPSVVLPGCSAILSHYSELYK